jgi:hypothetical protein
MSTSGEPAMRLDRSLLAVTCFPLLVAAALRAAPTPRSTGQIDHALSPPAAARSTGKITRSLAPAPPLPEPTPLAMPKDSPLLLQEGMVSFATPRQFSVALPPHQRVEIRVFAPESAAVQEEIYRGASPTAEGGCTAADGCVGWISTTSEGGTIRIGVRTQSATEVAFKVGVRLSPETKEP